MKKIFFLLTLLFLQVSCQERQFSVESEISESFYNDDNFKELKGLADTLSVPSAAKYLLPELKRDIRKYDTQYQFSTNFIKTYGLPIWKLSIPIDGTQEKKVLIPIVMKNSEFVGKMLFCVKPSYAEWRYRIIEISSFRREVTFMNAENQQKEHDLLNFMFLLFNQKISGVQVPCSIGKNIEQLNEKTLQQLKGAKTTDCFTLAGWDGYCSWGGTPDDPYKYFNGCTGQYISTQVCYDNPDAFWAHTDGRSIGLSSGVGGPPPANGEDPLIPGITLDPGINVLNADCSSFRFRATTTSGQEAAIKFSLKFGGSTTTYPPLIIQYKYFSTQVPIDTWDGQHISPGAAANRTAWVFNYATRVALDEYRYLCESGSVTSARLYSEVDKAFRRAYSSGLVEEFGAGRASIKTIYSPGSVPPSNLVPALSSGAYHCDDN